MTDHLSERTPGEILADSSVADFIRELGLGIAAAQTALDDNSIRQIDPFTTRRDDLGGRSLLDLGLSPAFYHYQHADIVCSMQLRMEVGRSDELGFGARVGVNDTQSENSSSETSSTSTTSGSRTEVKRASLKMRAESQGALTLSSGETFTPAGDNPAARLADLRRLLTAGDSGIDTVIERAPDARPAMSLNTPTDKVLVNSPTVTFLRPDSDNAAFRIRENQDTDFVVNGTLSIGTTAQADLTAYAVHVEAQLVAAGFTTARIEPGPRRRIATPQYDTGVSDLRPIDRLVLVKLADVLKGTGLIVEIEGLTDRQGAQARNIALGTARAEKCRDFLLAQGVPPAQLTLAEPASRGEALHRADDPTGPEDNQTYRSTRITILNLDYHLVTAGNGPDFDPALVSPNDIGNGSGPNNAYVALYDAASLASDLSGNGVTVEGTSFSFSESANGSSAGTAESYANNLARDINAAANLSAWAQGNVVRVARAGDAFDIQLFSTDDRELRVAESSDFAITEQFSRTRREVRSADREANRAIAVGVSIDARTSRQYNLELTGNSTISARLVSVPAPPAFLEQIRAFQAGRDE